MSRAREGRSNILPAALTFSDVSCARGDRLLFARLSFALGPGQAAVATGPNGAGKSSLLRLAAGLLAPLAGVVAASGRVALDTEALALDRHLPLARALGFWAGLDDAGADRLAGALEAMGLTHLAEVPVRLLSTGQRRRAGLARVIASGAPIWLLDEPANGLDTGSLARLGKALAVHRSTGGLILAASHVPLGLAGAREIAL